MWKRFYILVEVRYVKRRIEPIASFDGMGLPMEPLAWPKGEFTEEFPPNRQNFSLVKQIRLNTLHLCSVREAVITLFINATYVHP